VKVLILHTTPPPAPGDDRVADEFDLSEAASNVAAALPEAAICGISGDAREILGLLDLHLPAVVFNCAKHRSAARTWKLTLPR
jgi:hypothetical protein